MDAAFRVSGGTCLNRQSGFALQHNEYAYHDIESLVQAADRYVRV